MYRNQTHDLSFNIENDRIKSSMVLSQTVIKLYRSRTRSHYINVYSRGLDVAAFQVTKEDFITVSNSAPH